MPSLFHTLNIGSEALYATRQGVDTTGHNIANAQTPGYSRQRVNITQRTPLDVHNLVIGNGVYVDTITRSHDKFIERQINVANQDVGRSRAFAEAMKTMEIIFSPELQSSVSDELTSFFNAVQDLSGFPEDYTVRTSVVESAKNVCASFRRVDVDLKDVRDGVNERIFHTAEGLTQNLKEIASLNIKIQTLEAGQRETANDMRDQRDRILREVCQQIDCNYYQDKNGMLVLRGPKEVTLVDAGNSSTISVSRNSGNDGMYDIKCTDWEGKTTRDITAGISGGEMRALLDVRDDDIPRILDANNEMAATFVESFNTIHRQGYGIKDFSEKVGRNFFKEPSSFETAAYEMELDDVIYESVDAIAAASSPEAPGDNVIANQLALLKDKKVFGPGDTNFQEFYSNYVGALGLTVVRAEHTQQANDILIEDLTRRREAISGVSLDEEATNLLKWQTCFAANSKVITTVDEMLDTVLSLKR